MKKLLLYLLLVSQLTAAQFDIRIPQSDGTDFTNVVVAPQALSALTFDVNKNPTSTLLSAFGTTYTGTAGQVVVTGSVLSLPTAVTGVNSITSAGNNLVLEGAYNPGGNYGPILRSGAYDVYFTGDSLWPPNASSLGRSNNPWSSVIASGLIKTTSQSGFQLGDSTYGPTLTATGSSPNESLLATIPGTGTLVAQFATVKIVHSELAGSGFGTVHMLATATAPTSANWMLTSDASTLYIKAPGDGLGSCLYLTTNLLRPVTSDGTLDLGSAANRFGVVYAASLRTGPGAATAKVGGTIFDHYTDTATVSVDGTEDNLYSDTTVASTLGADGDAIMEWETVTTVAGATKSHRVQRYFAGTNIFDTGTVTGLAGVTTYSIHTFIQRESSTVVRATVTVIGPAVGAPTYTRITGLTLSDPNILKTTGIATGVGVAVGDIINKISKIKWKSAD